MPSKVTNYQCPNCTGPMKYDPKLGKLHCEYCESEYSVAEVETIYAKAQAEAEAEDKAAQQRYAKAEAEMGGAEEWSAGEAEHLRAYHCPSCGAELICDANTAATSCVYCGNPSIVPGRLSGNLKPDLVIPFALTKENAVETLKAFSKGKPLLPKAFSSRSHLEEVQGVYVPFWLFDGEADGTAVFHAQKVRHWREGRYDVTETQYYELRRSGSLPFQRIPVDGSQKMDDDYMDSIEPFDYGGLVPFAESYLSGFLADKYDVDASASLSRAAERAKQSLMDHFRGTVDMGYSAVTVRSEKLGFYPSRSAYALLPVWLLHTRWKEKDYYYAINGQTGRVAGDLPTSKARFFAWLFGLWGGLSVIAVLLRLFLG